MNQQLVLPSPHEQTVKQILTHHPMHSQPQMAGMDQMNCGTQTESTEIVDIKELQFLYESLQKELITSKETLHARYKHDMNVKLFELWVKIKAHLQAINRERQSAEQRLRLAAQTRVADAAAKITQEFRAKQNHLIANIHNGHQAELETFRIQLAQTNLEKLKAIEKAQRFEHVIWRQGQALQRHRVPENEIHETENGEFIVEKLQDEIHEKEETIADLERKVFQLEQDLKRYETLDDQNSINGDNNIPVKPHSRPGTGGSASVGESGITSRRRGAIGARTEPNRNVASARLKSAEMKLSQTNEISDRLTDNTGENTEESVDSEDQGLDQDVINEAIEQVQADFEQKMQELREEQEMERAKFKLEMNRMQRQYQKQLTVARESAEKVQNADLVHTVLSRQESILKFATVLFGKQQQQKHEKPTFHTEEHSQQQRSKRKTVKFPIEK